MVPLSFKALDPPLPGTMFHEVSEAPFLNMG